MEEEEEETGEGFIEDDQVEQEEDINEEEGEETLQYAKMYRYYEPEREERYPNHSITQSKVLNRVFVCRGPLISVFKANDSLEVIILFLFVFNVFIVYM